jgi:hypothetical protein
MREIMMRRFLNAVVAMIGCASAAFAQGTAEPIGRSGQPVATGVGPLSQPTRPMLQPACGYQTRCFRNTHHRPR